MEYVEDILLTVLEDSHHPALGIKWCIWLLSNVACVCKFGKSINWGRSRLFTNLECFKYLKTSCLDICIDEIVFNTPRKHRVKFEQILFIWLLINFSFLACAYPSLWQDLTSRLNVNVEELINKNKERVLKLVAENCKEKVASNIVKCIFSLCLKCLAEIIWQYGPNWS